MGFNKSNTFSFRLLSGREIGMVFPLKWVGTWPADQESFKRQQSVKTHPMGKKWKFNGNRFLTVSKVKQLNSKKPLKEN
jgi:hypothetical protein